MGRFPDPLVTKFSGKLVEPVWEPLEKLEKTRWRVEKNQNEIQVFHKSAQNFTTT